MLTIGQSIRERRKAANLTQSDIAYILSVTQSTVAKWERDEGRMPDILTLWGIADYLNISIDELVGRVQGEA